MILEFLANGFEEIEALTPVDLLRRAGAEILTVAVGDGRTVTGSHGITVTAELTSAEAKARYADERLDMVILPGGMPGAKNLDEDEIVDFFVRKAAADEGTVLAAICAAPMIPGKRGLLAGYRAVCYPGWEDKLDGAILTGGRVEADRDRITGCGMGAATEFALALVGVLKGDEAAEKLSAAILAK